MPALDRLRSSGQVRCVPLEARAGSGSTSGNVGREALEIVGPVSLPLALNGTEYLAKWYVARKPEGDEQGVQPYEEVSVLQFGGVESDGSRPLVRIHSACLTGDTLGSLRCDCGPQLRAAMHQIADGRSGGLLIYMTSHEGRGIGLWSKAAAYILQEEGLDTYEANRALGFEEDQRDFRMAVAVLRDRLGDRPIELLTNNPLKVKSLERFGVTDVRRRGLAEGASEHNRCYLRAKRGHLLPR